MPGGSSSAVAVTTAAPAPSPKMMAVDRSVQSMRSESFSAPITMALREAPARIAWSTVASAYEKPEQAVLRSNAPGALMPSVGATRVATFGQRSTEEQVATTTRSMSAGGQAGAGERLLRGGGGHVGHGLLGGGDPPGRDADAVADPLVVGVDHLGEVVVGEHPRRLVVAEADDAGAGHECSESSDAGEGLARTDRVIVVREPLDRAGPESCAVTSALPCRVTMWPSTWPALIWAPSSRSGSGSNVPADGRHRQHERHGRLVAGRHAVAGDEVLGRLQVVRGVQRDDLGALELPLGQPGQGAGRRQLDDAGDAEVGQRAHAQVPAHRARSPGRPGGPAWSRRR